MADGTAQDLSSAIDPPALSRNPPEPRPRPPSWRSLSQVLGAGCGFQIDLTFEIQGLLRTERDVKRLQMRGLVILALSAEKALWWLLALGARRVLRRLFALGAKEIRFHLAAQSASLRCLHLWGLCQDLDLLNLRLLPQRHLQVSTSEAPRTSVAPAASSRVPEPKGPPPKAPSGTRAAAPSQEAPRHLWEPSSSEVPGLQLRRQFHRYLDLQLCQWLQNL